jgi:fatty acid synthase subunit alpha
MLGDIENELVQKILETFYGGDESHVPTVDYIGGSAPHPTNFCVEDEIHVQQTDRVFEYQIGSRIPDSASWLECIAGPSVGWLRAILTTPIVVQEKSFIDNPLKRLFAPRKGQKVVVDHSKATISLYGAGRSFGPHPADFKAVDAEFDSGQIKVTINEERKGVSIPLTLIYTYRPDQGYAPIHEVMEDRTTRIKDFYWRLWFGEDETMSRLDCKQVFEGPEVTIDAKEVERFCAVVRNDGEAFKGTRTENVRAPLDFAIVTGWQVRNLFIFLNHDSLDL